MSDDSSKTPTYTSQFYPSGSTENSNKGSQQVQTTESASSSQRQGIALPVVQMPKGGGAIKGIGEKFQANPISGTGSISIPLPLTPGRSGFTPALSLGYDSGSGNGAFGLGWNVGVPSISRKTDKGLPRYEDDKESDI